MRKTILPLKNKENEETKMNLSQSIVNVTERLMQRESEFIIDTDYGRYYIRKGYLTTTTITHHFEKWDSVFPDKRLMYHLRDTTIEAMITIDRSIKLNVQFLIVARALCEAYLRYVGYTDYIREDVVDTLAAMWIRGVSGKIEWYKDSQKLSEDFIAGAGTTMMGKGSNAMLMLESFSRQYFFNKFEEIKSMSGRFMATIYDIEGKILKENDAIGWPIVSPFYRMVVAAIIINNQWLSDAIKGIKRVRKNPNLNNNTFILREIFNPHPYEEKKEDGKHVKKGDAIFE